VAGRQEMLQPPAPWAGSSAASAPASDMDARPATPPRAAPAEAAERSGGEASPSGAYSRAYGEASFRRACSQPYTAFLSMTRLVQRSAKAAGWTVDTCMQGGGKTSASVLFPEAELQGLHASRVTRLLLKLKQQQRLLAVSLKCAVASGPRGQHVSNCGATEACVSSGAPRDSIR